MISTLHYITQHVPDFTHAELAEFACKGGGNWVQLRVKNISYDEWKSIAIATQTICRKYHAVFIINDNVQLAKEIGADGVHLGKEDMGIEEARKILGKNFIIGGTANTIEDVEKLFSEGVNYIGLGPLRFTSTKENLSPTLGIDGYKNILGTMKEKGIIIPVIAIGGIMTDDIPEILKTGAHGIAVSSAINLAENKPEAAKQFVQLVSNNQTRVSQKN